MKNKPYFYVDPVEKSRFPPREGDHNGQLRVTINILTPTHFGAGLLEFNEEGGTFIHKLNQENGKISLPGSSFKGMLRSVFEAVSESCMVTDEDGRCSDNKNICSACKMFGRLGKKGQLGFSSFALIEGSKPEIKYLPTLHHNDGGSQLDDSDDKPQQRKFYKHSSAHKRISEASRSNKDSARYECLPVGAKLQGIVSYHSLSDDQLGGLLFALGLGWKDENGNEVTINHKLGYGKPAYFGSVHIEVSSERREAAIVKRDYFSGDKLKGMANDYYEKHESTIGVAVAELREEWAFKGIEGLGDHCKEDGWNLQTLNY
jgi:CRISPR/Cas system CSM-associated protein Csm3 (group 7 of RAMP superfamily)